MKNYRKTNLSFTYLLNNKLMKIRNTKLSNWVLDDLDILHFFFDFSIYLILARE